MNVSRQIAVAICTYNPNPQVFYRCLASVETQLQAHPGLEVVIVDNNSSPALEVDHYVCNLLASYPNVRLVLEQKQGLTFARIAAFNHSSAPWLVLVDDDNELHNDYLDILTSYTHVFPNVGAWGPGTVNVEFIGCVSESVLKHLDVFQERKAEFSFACIPAQWLCCYPYGSGMAIRRDVMKSYVSRFISGQFTMTDRCGASLASAGDIQIVWEAVRMHYAAGLIPELMLNHLITTSRTSSLMLAKLCFGTASSYYPALFQSFPDSYRNLPPLAPWRQIISRLVRYWIKASFLRSSSLGLSMSMAEYIGINYGLSLARSSGSVQSSILFKIARLAKFV